MKTNVFFETFEASVGRHGVAGRISDQMDLCLGSSRLWKEGDTQPVV